MDKEPQNRPVLINSGNFLAIDKRVIFYLLTVIGIYWLASLYRAAISSLVLGLLLAYLLHPLVKFLKEKIHLNYRFSVGLIFISFVTLILIATRAGTPIVFKQIGILTNDFQNISNELIKLQPTVDRIVEIDLPLAELIPELENEISQFLVPARLFRMLRSATGNMVWIMVTFMTCFYVLLDHAKMIKWIYQITPQTMRADLGHILEEVNLVWKTYLRGQFSMMLLIGLLSGIGGVLVGLKNALIIGVIAGLLEMIPSLGPTIATFIAGMSAWTQGSATLNISNFWFMILVCGIFILIQLLENTILIPRVMSKRMKLHPALVFVAIVSTLALFGVLAGLIVIPVIGSVVVIINNVFHSLDRNTEEGIPPELLSV